MSETVKAVGKATVIPMQLGLLIALVLGVWRLSDRVHQWEMRLSSMERQLVDHWSWRMEEDAWREFESTGKSPDIDRIRERYRLP